MNDWIEHIAYEHERPRNVVAPEPRLTLADIARWLSRPSVLDYVRKQTWARDFHDEILAAIERCEEVIKPPHERESRIVIGPHEGCGGRVVATIPPEGGYPSAVCGACGVTWRGVMLREVAQRPDDMRPVWVSVETAAEMLATTTRWVRYLVAKGRLREERFSARRRLVHKGDVLTEAGRRQGR